MNIRIVNKDKKELEKVNVLYEEAFPENERIDLEVLKGNEIHAFYDPEFIGFASTITYKNITNISYLAVKEELRDQGYGSQILDSIKEEYLNNTITVDIEKLNGHPIREKRKAFYLRNGFKETPLKYTWRNENFNILSTKEINKEDYIHFWNKILDERRVIFLDIDGTLVGKSRTLTPKVKEALIKAREKGHLIFICSGRNRAGVSKMLEEGCFDGAICSAGAYIEVKNQCIYSDYIDKENVYKAIEVFKKNDVLYNLEATDRTFQSDEISRIFINMHGQDLNSEAQRLKHQQEEFNVQPLEDFNGEPIQTICFMSDNEDNLKEPIEVLNPLFHLIIYDKNINGTIINGELMKKGIDKGTGVKKIMDYLDLPYNHSIGFGDSMNDLEMLMTCKYSVVMQNGDDIIKKYADTICESVEDDGIYYEFKRLGLI